MLADEIPRRYDGSRRHDIGLLSSRYVLAAKSISVESAISGII
ncbi:hypothetical protein [Wolbachia endosymbiont (group A) of Beris morrisii]